MTIQIDFPLLKLVNDARSTYGLRHQDFGRYKSHCTSKVQHLRKAAGLSQTSGRGKKYTKKEVTSTNVTSDKHLQILLFDSERCWAHSQLLKSTLSLPTTSAETKHHLSRRLSRSLLAASKLLALVQSPTLSTRISISHKAQVVAYHLALKGTLAFEKEKHEEGLQVLSVAYVLLNLISTESATAQEEALANEMMDEVEPMLRFCAYSLQLDISNGVAGIAKETCEAHKLAFAPDWEEFVSGLKGQGGKTSREKVELVWRGEEIVVRNVELVKVVLGVQEAIKSLEKEQQDVKGKRVRNGGKEKELMGARRMGVFDKALLVLADSEEKARQLMEDNKIALSVSHSPRFEATSASLSRVCSYIAYYHLSVLTKRDLLLISHATSSLSNKLSKIATKEAEYFTKYGKEDKSKREKKERRVKARVGPGLCKIYDGVLLRLEQMRDLDLVENDGDLSNGVEARIAFVKAKKCHLLSTLYSLLSLYPSSLSLLSRAKLYSRQSASLASSLSPNPEDHFPLEPDFSADLLPLDTESFAELDQELNTSEEKTGREWFNYSGGVVEGDVGAELGLEGLSLEDEKALELAGTGTEAGKKSKKPIFYDVAFNYVVSFNLDAIARKAGLTAEEEQQDQEMVDQEEEEEEEQEEEQEKKEVVGAKKGWGFGLFGR